MLWLNLIPLCNGKTPTDFREARISWLRLCLCLILYMCVQENLILKEKQNKTKLLRKELLLGCSFKKGVGRWGYEQGLELKSTGKYVTIVPADTLFFFFFPLEVTRTNIGASTAPSQLTVGPCTWGVLFSKSLYMSIYLTIFLSTRFAFPILLILKTAQNSYRQE